MDAVIGAAARALAAGNPLGALNRVALREDPAALALRGIAMAQLGSFERAKGLLKRARQSFGSEEVVSSARCIIAEAEIALASRALRWPDRALAEAQMVLVRYGDSANAAHAHQLEVRHLLLLGKLDEAEQKLAELNAAALPPAQRATQHLILAGIAMRRIHATVAGAALAQARQAALDAGIPALLAEIEAVTRELEAPVARGTFGGQERLLRLSEVEELLASPALVIDACRLTIRCGSEVVPLARRPVLFALARALGAAWPGSASRAVLMERAFQAAKVDESHRARLRVEMGRLREILKGLAQVGATREGFTLAAPEGRDVWVLVPLVEDEHATVLAFLADGEAWPSSSLAAVLGVSQRTVQRALDALESAGKVQGLGRGRAKLWTRKVAPGFATTLLLPGPLPGD